MGDRASSPLEERRWFPFALGCAFWLLAAILTKHYTVSWNDRSRMATIEALVVHHTFAIDGSTAFPTHDEYRFAGRFYSDKPPALALAGAAIALPLGWAGISVERAPRRAYYFVTVALVGLTYAAGLVALLFALRELGAGAVWSLCVTLVAGLATFLLPYATILNNHVVSGALLMIGFALAIGRRTGGVAVALSGLAFALAAAVDIAFGVFLVLAPVLLCAPDRRRFIPAFAAAAAPIVAIYFGLNVALSGSPLPPAMNLPLWQYPGSMFDRSNLTGLAVDRSVADHLVYALDLLGGNHGLFSYMPVLLFGLAGLAVGWRAAPSRRPALVFIAAGVACYVGSYAWSSNNYSGDSYGIRWWAGIVDLACVPLAFLEPAVARSRMLRVAFVGATLVSSFVAVVGLVDLASPSDNGIAPLLFNVQTLAAQRHFGKDGVYALIIVLTTAAAYRLAQAVADGRRESIT